MTTPAAIGESRRITARREGPSIELFLSPAGERGASLARGLDEGALAAASGAAPEPAGDAVPIPSFDPSGDPNSLRDQGWGVIAPRGEEGDRLLALARPLIERRAAEQGGEVAVYRVPPGMTAAQSAAWIDRKLVGNELLEAIPGYLLVLGRPDQISFELQQVLTAAFSVGRLGFDADADYEAYIAKLAAAESAAPQQPRAIYFTARDGTAATELGHRLLMQPCLADAERLRASSRLALRELTAIDDADPTRGSDRLLAAAASPGPAILFSCSHGAGAPRGGWRESSHQRALQGALCLGGGLHLERDVLAHTPFCPGGAWLMFACFGAGTPAHSAYLPWLLRLRDHGEVTDSDLSSILASLPADGAPPFLAAPASAALSNPRGPLSIIGHLDLAWTHSFQDLDKLSRADRHRRFHELVAQLAKGARVGLALHGTLARARNQLQLELGIAAAAAEAPSGPPPPEQQLRLGHRWMSLQDLSGYIVLGDPASRVR